MLAHNYLQFNLMQYKSLS